MHLQRKMDRGEYPNADSFAADVQLIFSNCYKYNPSHLEVVAHAKKLQVGFTFHLLVNVNQGFLCHYGLNSAFVCFRVYLRRALRRFQMSQQAQDRLRRPLSANRT